MKMFYTGDSKFLIEKKYEFESLICGKFFAKVIEHKTTKKQLKCYVDLRTLEITFYGDKELIPYYEQELKGKYKYE